MTLSKSGIDYLTHLWTPYSGCRHWQTGVCGGGSQFYCWAKRITGRFPHHYPNGFEPTFYPDRFLDPCHRRKPATIGVAFMGDLFGDWVDPRMPVSVTFPDGQKIINCSFCLVVKDIIQHCPQHTFLFLTKAPWNLRLWNPWPVNAWVGATATNLEQYRAAIVGLDATEARVKYISFEPLLERIPIAPPYALDGIRWVIIGGKSGKGKFCPPGSWILEIEEASDKGGIPVFEKDNLYKGKKSLRQEFPKEG